MMTSPSRSNPVREEIQRLRETRGASAPAMIRRVRAQAAADQFLARVDRSKPFPVRTRKGSLEFARVEYKEISSDTSCVEVWVGDDAAGPPHYRLFNPPTLAIDPQGDVEIEGQRYREDPLASIAEVILGSQR